MKTIKEQHIKNSNKESKILLIFEFERSRNIKYKYFLKRFNFYSKNNKN